MKFNPKLTLHSASTIVGMDNNMSFISENVDSFRADVGNSFRIVNRIVDTDFILSSLAQVTSISSWGMRIPEFSTSFWLYVPDASVSAIAFMVLFCNMAAYNRLLVILLLLVLAHEERGIFLFNTLVILVLQLSYSVLPRHQAVKLSL